MERVLGVEEWLLVEVVVGKEGDGGNERVCGCVRCGWCRCRRGSGIRVAGGCEGGGEKDGKEGEREMAHRAVDGFGAGWIVVAPFCLCAIGGRCLSVSSFGFAGAEEAGFIDFEISKRARAFASRL